MFHAAAAVMEEERSSACEVIHPHSHGWSALNAPSYIQFQLIIGYIATFR